jgi:hypothetical protein
MLEGISLRLLNPLYQSPFECVHQCSTISQFLYLALHTFHPGECYK